MMGKRNHFISFEFKNDQYVASMSVDDFLGISEDPELLLNMASKIYSKEVIRLHLIMGEINKHKKEGKPILAREAWILGDRILKIQNNLYKLNLELDDTYWHLEKHVGIKKDFLEKIISFRRYLPDNDLIPKSLNWRRCRTAPRIAAMKLTKQNRTAKS